ncbi:MAG: SusD/RagB family nutrient-binding outer membrane lipoprotein [Janthinobacterium lividum]
MKKYISLICVAITIANSSCKKNYLDLSVNPNTPSVAAPNLILSGALKTTAGIVNGGLNNAANVANNINFGFYTQYANWVGYLSQSTSYQPFVTLEQYAFTSSDYDVWTRLYANLANYKAIIDANAGPNITAIAKIMTAFDYQQLVDNYNNVPYTQALQGSSSLNPMYDNGSAIYDDLLKQLDASIALIQGAPVGAANPGTSDVMFGGNMDNWKKFANTLKLRLAIRQSNLSAKQAALKASISATVAVGYLDATNPAVVNPGYTNIDANGGQQSPLWINYGTTQSGNAQTNNAQYQANSYAATFFASNNDPRLVQIYSNIATAVTATSILNGTVNVQNGKAIVATPFGGSQPPTGVINGVRTPLAVSKFGPGILKSATMPAVILSSAESLFLQAEGVAEGLITGNAVTFYNAGISASFADDLVPSAASAAATYYAQPAIAYPVSGSVELQKQAIVTQKWAALVGYGAFEAFNELRRTGYPNVPVSIFAGAGTQQVSRIFYPAIEFQTNADNVGAQGTIDKFTSKIFWAK